MSKPSSPRPSTKAMSSSWTIWPPTRARPPRRPSRPGVHGSYSCHPIALTSIQSKWPSQSLKPISAQKPSGPSMPSGRRSGTSAISSSLRNAKTTSPPPDMDSAERPAPLKPRNIRERQLAPMHMHPAELRAAMEHGKHFSRIEQLLLVERGLDCNLLGEIDVVEHFWHQIAFFDADAMFARQHAADRNA